MNERKRKIQDRTPSIVKDVALKCKGKPLSIQEAVKLVNQYRKEQRERSAKAKSSH
jgi:hypothetical protein